ncbi:uncharacterized protein LOC108867954 [Pyrus x bretschneideri]|uniref:uncharacterized protein LOC108867954 n=1 Tax=Pyrus x bretschneideri TaxID=225117 RepID=UPI00202F1022|nr:uncharacterized protein LOC108867954 [Pyrus x bretschneideri]
MGCYYKLRQVFLLNLEPAHMLPLQIIDKTVTLSLDSTLISNVKIRISLEELCAYTPFKVYHRLHQSPQREREGVRSTLKPKPGYSQSSDSDYLSTSPNLATQLFKYRSERSQMS